MTLFLFVAPAGYHKGAWRLPDSNVETLYGPELPFYIAKVAEAAKIDALLFADWLSFEATGENPDLTGYEPLTTMAAVSGVTEHVGLVGTASTSFWEPFHLARMLSQIDHLSKGRCGWNIVTSTTGAENFTKTLLPHDVRYERAYEFVAALDSLWSAWGPEAVRNDRQGGVWADRGQIRWPCHAGPTYTVEGPLLTPRSPQVRPLLTQAGGSKAGRTFAAKVAEVVYCVATEKQAAFDYRADLRHRAQLAGRDPDSILVLPGLMPILGATQSNASRHETDLARLVQTNSGLATLSLILHRADLSTLPLDAPIPDGLLPAPTAVAAEGGSSRYPDFYALAVTKRLTLRELIAIAGRAEGHHVAVGSYDEIAQLMRDWYLSGACDGFVLMPPSVPDGLEQICGELVPRLYNQGVFQSEYASGSLRDRLDVPAPQ